MNIMISKRNQSPKIIVIGDSYEIAGRTYRQMMYEIIFINGTKDSCDSWINFRLGRKFMINYQVSLLYLITGINMNSVGVLCNTEFLLRQDFRHANHDGSQNSKTIIRQKNLKYIMKKV